MIWFFFVDRDQNTVILALPSRPLLVGDAYQFPVSLVRVSYSSNLEWTVPVAKQFSFTKKSVA